ncbi:MAG: regulator of sigma protease [Eubacteriales bacterium]|nr:regulator of sigma protease [Eubacteriales bacterium]
MNTALAVIFVFGLVIIIHELGHFLVAKLAGITVYEFSVGFGPRVFGFRYGETRYNLRLLPLGGFVRAAGMDEEDDLREARLRVAEERGLSPQQAEALPAEEVMASLDRNRFFRNRPLYQRALMIVAGSLMNFVLAIVLFFIIFAVIGVPNYDAPPVIGEVKAGFPAEKVGMKPGDRLVAVDGKKVEKWDQLLAVVRKKAGQPVRFTVLRDGRELQFIVTPVYDRQVRGGVVGITQRVPLEPLPVLKAARMALASTGEIAVRITEVLRNFFRDKSHLQDIAGPVRMTVIIKDAAKMGLNYLLWLTAVISINLGIFNLLPIPALDGSRLLFLAAEAIRGKPVDPNKENMVHLVGFALLLLLMVVITYNDIIQLLKAKGGPS